MARGKGGGNHPQKATPNQYDQKAMNYQKGVDADKKSRTTEVRTIVSPSADNNNDDDNNTSPHVHFVPGDVASSVQCTPEGTTGAEIDGEEEPTNTSNTTPNADTATTDTTEAEVDGGSDEDSATNAEGTNATAPKSFAEAVCPLGPVRPSKTHTYKATTSMTEKVKMVMGGVLPPYFESATFISSEKPEPKRVYIQTLGMGFTSFKAAKKALPDFARNANRFPYVALVPAADGAHTAFMWGHQEGIEGNAKVYFMPPPERQAECRLPDGTVIKVPTLDDFKYVSTPTPTPPHPEATLVRTVKLASSIRCGLSVWIVPLDAPVAGLPTVNYCDYDEKVADRMCTIFCGRETPAAMAAKMNTLTKQWFQHGTSIRAMMPEAITPEMKKKMMEKTGCTISVDSIKNVVNLETTTAAVLSTTSSTMPLTTTLAAHLGRTFGFTVGKHHAVKADSVFIRFDNVANIRALLQGQSSIEVGPWLFTPWVPKRTIS